MSCDFLKLANAGIQGLMPYQPGKPVEEVARELNLDPDSIVKLASNENPHGPGQQALNAIQRELTELARYPDGSGYRLKAALAQKLGLSPRQITLGNGSNDLLDLVGRCWLAPGRNAVYSEYAFAVYPITTQAAGAAHKVVPARDWGHDLNAMAQAIDENTGVVFIANPNNPTGTWLSEKQLREFMAQVPEQVLVVLDEAYFEYVEESVYPDGVALLQDYPNLLVCRTFSKAYGLASLRVGYSLSSVGIAETLNRVRQPFNVNSLALEAALAALGDEAYLQQSVITNKAGMLQLETAFRELGLNYIPSVGNFICVDVGDAEAVNQALLKEGVIVRPLRPYRMNNHLRISIGLPEENQRFIDALKKVL
ncbi:histidinol-phosphate transaminase [Marinospirillum alkaliphilum]|uniref:Histidinol-phosphate aminotransferase n=1 Tax=Marinospirillum alkaliphilum DSM 21637 TaxID=1122209 RepID=A0A1K1TMD5_9GAMM|nr:histidinol-phosphate transaminase [Marinospirillum alkaliphilum]SFX01618.1 histidinol-phosphate aminotransferase [Marinospirillum alkaliphilum DSM 21637]